MNDFERALQFSALIAAGVLGDSELEGDKFGPLAQKSAQERLSYSL